MKRETKLSSEQQQSQETGTEQQTRQQSALEFGTAEEMLRYDAAHTPVPPGIEARLQKSTEGLPPPARPWWKRLFQR